MDKKRSQSLHFGGPLGLAGLAVLASATGIVVFGGESEKDETVSPLSTPKSAETRPVNTPVESQTDVTGKSGELVVTAKDSTGLEEPRVKPAKQESITVKPAAAQRGAEVTYIVRIKGVPEIDEAARLYRRDYSGALKVYKAYQAKTPALEGFRLVGASYSGEVKLAYDLAPGIDPSRDVVQAVQDELTAIDGFAYADPDYIAHPGEGD